MVNIRFFNIEATMFVKISVNTDYILLVDFEEENCDENDETTF